jgi:triphosphatase
MTDIRESEYKLRATRPLEVAAVDAVLRELGLPCRATATSEHTDTYLDDERGTLLAAGIGLRLRHTDGKRVLTCKNKGTQQDGLFVREEVDGEWAAASTPTRASELPPPLRDRIEPFVLDGALTPFLQLGTQREIRRLSVDDHEPCELAIDRVQASAAGRTAVFQEVEIEFERDAAAWERVARALQHALPLAVADDDKPTHAAHLLGLADATPATGALDPSAPIADTVRGLVERHLDELRRSEAAVRCGRGEPALHELRVVARRLRSLVRTFRDLWTTDDFAALADQLQQTGRRLGSVRDLDVMLALLRRDHDRLPAPLQPPAAYTIAWLARQRTAADAELQAWLRADDRLRAQADCERRLRAIDAAAPVAAIPTRIHVQQRIAAAATRVRKLVGALPPELPYEPLHQLRIASKRLRYVAEAFAAMPDQDRDHDKALARVTTLQQRLGDVCDHEVAQQRLLDWLRPAVADSDDGAMTAAAIGAMAACHANAATKARKAAQRAIGRVDKKRVWRLFDAETDAPDAKLAT